MAGEFRMGMAGAFFGAGQALAEIGKEKTAESGVAYSLYIKLSQDPKFKKVGDWEYKRGMTRVDVMRGFEEDTEYVARKTGGSRILLQTELDGLASIFEQFKGAEEGDFTVDAAKIIVQARGQTLRRKTAVEKMALQEFDALMKRGMQTEAAKVKILNTLTKMHIDDINERLSDLTVGPVIKELFNRADFQTEPRYGKLRQFVSDITGRRVFGQPFEAKKKEFLKDAADIDKLMKKYNYDDKILIPILIELGEIEPGQEETYRNAIRVKRGLSQQIAPPGVAGTGVEGAIGQDLRLGQPTLAPPSAIQAPGAGVPAQGAGVPAPGLAKPGASPSSFMPNASPYNRLKTLAYLRNIPRQR